MPLSSISSHWRGQLSPSSGMLLTQARLRKALFWGLPAVAGMMLLLSLLPVSAWDVSDAGASYRGFDPNLVFVREQGPGASENGIVNVSGNQIELTAVPSSEPTVHLLTTPLDFKAGMDVRVMDQPADGAPLKIGVWSVRAGSGYYIRFGSAGDNHVFAQLVSGGAVKKETLLGEYSPGQTYHLEIAADRKGQEIGMHLTAAPQVDGNVMRLNGGPAQPNYGDVLSDVTPVKAGDAYTFGGLVQVLSGTDAYKMSLSWYDANQRYLGFSQDWRRVDELGGWTRLEFSDVAPEGAAYARLVLGSGNQTSLLFTGLFLSRSDVIGETLLANGDFRAGLSGWHWANGKTVPTLIIRSPLDVATTLEAAEAPELFDSVRLTLTASSSSSGGVSGAIVDNYELTLPGELWQVVRTDDSKVLVGLVLTLGFLLCLAQTWDWRISRRRPAERRRLSLPADRHLTLPGWRLLALVGGGIAVYFVANMFLFHYGTQPFDMTSQEVWAYTGAKYGVFDIYPRGSTVSLAEVWNGAPYHEAVFPYPPFMAYYFGAVGETYKGFLNGSGPVTMDGYGLEFIIKTGSLLFGLANAVLIYLLGRGMKLTRPAALIPTALFLFNPAVAVDVALWGETENVSLFFLLLSMWQAQRKSPTGAWLALGAAILTRPQMAVPGVLLALVYLRIFGVNRSFRPVCWSVVLLYLALGPFLWHFSPSLPMDYATRVSSTHVLGGGESALQGVSLSGYSVWPMVTGVFEGVSGRTRSAYPESSSLIGGITYGEASNVLIACLVLAVAALIVRRRSTGELADYLPLVAFGMLGWSMLTTGMISRYFIYALALVIVSRPSLRPGPYFAVVGALTVTTFVTQLGAIGFAIRDVPQLAPLLHPSNNSITELAMNLYAADTFITLGVLANLLALVVLGAELIPRTPDVVRHAARVDVTEPVPG